MILATSTPNTHFAYCSSVPGQTGQLEVNRTNELAVECWSLRSDIYDKQLSNEQLQRDVERLRFALERSCQSFQTARSAKDAIEADRDNINKELLECRKKLSKVESTNAILMKTVTSLRRGKISAEQQLDALNKPATQLQQQNLKVNSSIDSSGRSNAASEASVVASSEQRAAELSKKCTKQTVEIKNLRRSVTSLEATIETLKKQVRILENSQKQDASLPASRALSFTTEEDDLMSNLEEAYEELHSKYEKIWAEKNSAMEIIQTLREQNAFLLAGGSHNIK